MGSVDGVASDESETAGPRNVSASIRYLLIDPDTFSRLALECLISSVCMYATGLQAKDWAEAQGLLDGHRFDLVVADFGLFERSISRLDGVLASIGEAALVLTGRLSDRRQAPLLARQGVKGYLPKTLPTATLRMGLEVLVSGGIFFPAEYSVQPGDRASHLPKLTRRQIQVLAGIANGQTTSVIAKRAGISEPTVKLHLATSMRVLGVKTRVAAVVLAERLGLLE
jgi:two-component system, NarL family, nitrate/nitrite response regulator NarL